MVCVYHPLAFRVFLIASINDKQSVVNNEQGDQASSVMNKENSGSNGQKFLDGLSGALSRFQKKTPSKLKIL
jgi:hypothetical protein